MSADRTKSFADALQAFEQNSDVDTFVDGAFADQVELVRPETGQQLHGTEGAREFWQQYLAQFDEIRSDFSRVVEGEVGVLEWTGHGRLAGGTEISYAGISVLDFDEDGRVTRFATYYDTAPFTLGGPTGPS